MTAPLISDPIIRDVSQIFDALGDVSRLKLLRVLLDAKTPMHQGALAEATGLSQANTSKHLAQLVRVGLVVREPHGTLVRFRPVSPLIENVCDLVCGFVTTRIKRAYDALA